MVAVCKDRRARSEGEGDEGRGVLCTAAVVNVSPGPRSRPAANPAVLLCAAMQKRSAALMDRVRRADLILRKDFTTGQKERKFTDLQVQGVTC